MTGGWPLLVLDGDGVLITSFPRAEFDRAHRWAHARAGEPVVELPILVEDLLVRVTWTIGRTSCTATRWGVLPDGPAPRLGCLLHGGARSGRETR
ncbi:hypothetical protein [Frankia sp. B2]|uniref:hypothetical protein n=1 Tax=Frankia sp. B2 TaxID=2541730 RepID=UPI001F0FCFBC|nr:hypothetical protein [Frankia sp. B2]